jgi:hypothetical protein
MLIEGIDWKIAAAVLSSGIAVLGYIPYLYGMIKGKTKPHIYTWLIWTITLGIGNASIWQGGGGIVLSVGILLSVILTFIIFILCFWYGSKNISLSDTAALIVALVAIYAWVGLHTPILALLIAVAIDLLGYWPTYRKSFSEPWSENLLSWTLYTMAPVLSLLALQMYNILTVTYSAATLVANIILVSLLLMRRRSIPKPA